MMRDLGFYALGATLAVVVTSTDDLVIEIIALGVSVIISIYLRKLKN